MEYGLGAKYSAVSPTSSKGVLILIVVEYGLGVYGGNDDSRLFHHVLILIVVEYGLGGVKMNRINVHLAS